MPFDGPSAALRRARDVAVVARQPPVQQRRRQAQRGIEIKHQLDGGQSRPAQRGEVLRQRRRQRADRRGQRADQAVAGKDGGAVAGGGLPGQQRVFERHQHAGIAAGRIDAADEGDQQHEGKRLGGRKYQAGENDQRRTGEKQAAQLEPRRDKTGEQGQRGGPQQRGAGDDADLLRAEACGRQIDRQNDDGKAVAESAQRAGGVQIENIGRRFAQAARHVSSPKNGARQRLAARS